MDSRQTIFFERGTLQDSLAAATEHALSIGALVPVPTGYDFIEDGGVRFFVRILKSLVLKDQEKTKSATAVNPFLPYEKDLFVADISGTHVAILNKFNVVERHLLIVTREFENQETMLTIGDFEALWACLSEYRSLGFYNGGEAAGASQSHKHLQVVPLPLAPEGPQIPMEPLLAATVFEGGLGKIPDLPFLHVVARLAPGIMKSPAEAARRTFDLYVDMLRYVKMNVPVAGRKERQSDPYCLLVTREWMFLVPRSQEFFEGISINSLGFAGALLVRNEEQMSILRKYGPITALKSVALPLDGGPVER